MGEGVGEGMGSGAMHDTFMMSHKVPLSWDQLEAVMVSQQISHVKHAFTDEQSGHEAAALHGQAGQVYRWRNFVLTPCSHSLLAPISRIHCSH